MKISICYSGLKNIDLYKKSIDSLFENILIENVLLKDCDYDIFEYSENIIFNENKYSEYNGGPTVVRTSTIEPMFHKIFMCNKLKCEKEIEENFLYDICIKSRFDFILNEKIELSNLNLNKVNIPNNGISTINGVIVGVCDFFAISNSINMNKYSETYKELLNLFEKSILSNPESLLCEHIGIGNIDLIKIEHYVLRNNGHKLKFWFGGRELTNEQKKMLKIK